MDNENVKKELRKEWRKLWPRAMGGDGGVCPLCGYGGRSQSWGTGVYHLLQDENPDGLVCVGCGFQGDAVELLRRELEKDKGEEVTEDDVIREGITRLGRRPINAAEYLDTFWSADVAQMRAAENIRTGFSNIDNIAGGIYPGLYVLGALSSLGKTTFALQLADNLAASGQHVLFFSLEQSQAELVSKSLARLSAQASPSGTKYGIDALTIRKGFVDAGVKKAMQQYRETIAERMNIIQGDFKCDAKLIREEVNRFITENDVRPVVFVDYLQIIQQEDTRQSLREQIDSTVTELKRISREYSVPAFVISSVNRSNYLTPIDFESFKESGGIEYTADVVWGLQYQCLNEELFDKQNKTTEKRDRIREAKAEDPRKIELLCLKNRYGRDYRCSFDYFPRVDLFKVSESDSGNWKTV